MSFSVIEIAEMAVRLARDHGAEYADARAEQINRTSLRFVDGRFEQTVDGIEKGIGLRSLCSGAWGFACTTSFALEDLKEVALKAVKVAKANSVNLREKVVLSPVVTSEEVVETPCKEPLTEVPIDRKIDVVQGIYESAKAYSPKLVSITSIYGDLCGERAIATSEGTRLLLKPSRTLVGVNAVAKEGEKITFGFEREGALEGFEFYSRLETRGMAEKAAKKAVEMLKAKPSPSGRFTVVVDPKLGGVFAHEAVGHSCEGDYVMTGYSILHDKLGKRVGSEHVTIYDDSTYPNGWGSEKYDAEGVLTKKRLLIDQGIMKNFILSREAASKVGLPPNGGSRAQSYAFRPIVRMSNTYIAPGSLSLEEVLEGIENGVYVKGSMGGQVDPAKGTFQFAAEEAYLIERGQVTTPLLNVSLSGLTLETLLNIDAVGKDFGFNIGSCGKDDQSVPAGDGGPHLRIRNVVVGGKA